MKLLFVSAIVLSLFSCSAKAAETKSNIGYVNLDTILTESAPGKECTAAIQQLASSRQQTLASLLDTAKKATGKDVETKTKAAQDFRDSASKEIQEKLNECQKSIHDIAVQLTTTILTSKHLSIIFPIPAMAGGIDVTQDLLTAINAANTNAFVELRKANADKAKIQKELADLKAKTTVEQNKKADKK